MIFLINKHGAKEVLKGYEKDSSQIKYEIITEVIPGHFQNEQPEIGKGQ